VKQASEGALASSFDRLDALGVIAECAPDAARDQLAAAYVELAKRKESAIVVSQTWAEIDEINDRIRSGLRGRKLLTDEERTITAHKPVDLTTAQKQDARFYPEDHVIVFNRRVARCQRGDVGRLHAMTAKGAVIETGHSLHWLKPSQLDSINVCKPQRLALSQGDRLQLKANAVAADGTKLANGELVTVSKIKLGGEIVLTDGRTLPASYRQFVRGYAVTSYGSQGKTVDHVLLADSAIRAATNAQQWYVSISRGRKSVRIFTPDKAQLRTNVARSGDRPLAMDLSPPRNRREALRHILLHGARRGHAFARAICLAFTAKRRGATNTLKPKIMP
jgi:ATP-dependent exoDNAse (exonuclease V) alpha subunit